MTDDEERRRLVERAFGPGGTAAERASLAAYDRARAGATEHADPEPAASAPRSTASDLAPNRGVAAPRPTEPRGRAGAPALAVVALVLIAAAGAGGWLLGHASSAHTPSAPLAAARSQLVKVETVLPPFTPPEEFSEPQTPFDVPAVTLPSNLVRSSFRLEQSGPETLPGATKLYVARDTSGYDCLVVVHGSGVHSTCVSARYFPAGGLAITWASGATSTTATWLLDGTITVSSD